jgi:hypothetical protein
MLLLDLNESATSAQAQKFMDDLLLASLATQYVIKPDQIVAANDISKGLEMALAFHQN